MSFIDEPTNTKIDRRRLLQLGGFAGASLLGTSLLAGCGGSDSKGGGGGGSSSTDRSVLNFALNLEYLEAEFYQLAVNGAPLSAADTGGSSAVVTVKANPAVPFTDNVVRNLATEIAADELAHVRFLRSALGSSAVPQPAINLQESFNAAITAASGGAVTTFDPFANDLAFLIGAFIFEDVGVTAYRGGAPLLDNKTYLSAAAGILGVEAYHAGSVRTLLTQRGNESVPGTGLTVFQVIDAISNLRDTVDNTGGNQYSAADDDQGLANGTNFVPTDDNGLAFSRTVAQVLPIVYLGSNPATTPTPNSFFPNGINTGQTGASR